MKHLWAKSILAGLSIILIAGGCSGVEEPPVIHPDQITTAEESTLPEPEEDLEEEEEVEEVDAEAVLEIMEPAIKTAAYGWYAANDNIEAAYICYAMYENGNPHIKEGVAVFSEEEVEEIGVVLFDQFDSVFTRLQENVSIQNGDYYFPLAQPEWYEIRNPEYEVNPDNSIDVTYQYVFYPEDESDVDGIVTLHLEPNAQADESDSIYLPYIIASVERDDAKETAGGSAEEDANFKEVAKIYKDYLQQMDFPDAYYSIQKLAGADNPVLLLVTPDERKLYESINDEQLYASMCEIFGYDSGEIWSLGSLSNSEENLTLYSKDGKYYIATCNDEPSMSYAYLGDAPAGYGFSYFVHTMDEDEIGACKLETQIVFKKFHND